jgi:tubulin monoglycylase TTLL3/8
MSEYEEEKEGNVSAKK